jgi:protein gp37
MKDSKIEWTDHTFNPWVGCTKVSPGCLHCYAESLNQRWRKGVNWGKGAPRARTSEAYWKEPLKWNMQAAKEDNDFEGHSMLHGGMPHYDRPRRPRVFCASLADWLDDEVPTDWLADLLDLIRTTPFLDWLLLTKRPESFEYRLGVSAIGRGVELPNWMDNWRSGRSIPHNVWVGTSVEDQTRADLRIPKLLQIPARIRFLSVEPLLGPVDLSHEGLWRSTCERSAKEYIEAADDGKSHPGVCRDQADRWMDARADAKNVDWVICGGESGPMCRGMDYEWARSLARQCAFAKVPFFMKQLGGHPNKLHDVAFFPEELRVREFPI